MASELKTEFYTKMYSFKDREWIKGINDRLLYISTNASGDICFSLNLEWVIQIYI